MKRIFALVLILTTSLSFAQQKSEIKQTDRTPSTMGERLSFVKLAHYLEENPLAEDAKDKRGAAMRWLIGIPDLTVGVCDLVPEILKEKKNYSSELFGQMVISQAAFMIEYPETASDDELVFTAGTLGILKAYQSVLHTQPQAHWSKLDDLIAKKKTGEFVDYVVAGTKRCLNGEKGPLNHDNSAKPRLEAAETVPDNLVTAKDVRAEWYRMGNKFFDNGMYQQALIEYRRMLAADPKDSSALHEIGQTYWAMQNYEAALKFGKQAVEANKKCTICLLLVASVVDDMGKPEEALSYYADAINSAPREGKPLFEYAVTLHRLKRDPESEAALRKAIGLEPKYASPYRLLSTIVAKEKPFEAAKLLRTAAELEKDPKRADAIRETLKVGVHVDPKVLTPNGPRFRAYVAYASKRAEWIRATFAERFPDATEYQRTQLEEFEALSAEVTSWRSESGEKNAERDPELDRLDSIVKAGYLDAFVAQSMLKPAELQAWTQAHPQRIEEFLSWAAKKNVAVAPLKQEGFTIEWLGRNW